MTEQALPFFGIRNYARSLQQQLAERDQTIQALNAALAPVKGMGLDALQARKAALVRELEDLAAQRADSLQELERIRQTLAATDETAALQTVGVYEYQHPLADAVAYQARLAVIRDKIKAANAKDGGAISAAKDWTVNGSAAEGRRMVRETSKLMLRAFNIEADNLVRTLKPYKLEMAVDRLCKAAQTVASLGKTLNMRVSPEYLELRTAEMALVADYLHKQAAEKELERQERERMREERKAQQELERERGRLEKERQHYANALQSLLAKGDEQAAARMQAQLDDVARAIEDVDYRAANVRAGYVYVISNIGAFGPDIVKIGMTRRLDPLDRVRELGDASVPFGFDVHALFFSKDAVGIETEMHRRLAAQRVNQVNLRREFFRVTPAQVKLHLADLAGDLLEFHDMPEALEYRESLAKRRAMLE
ncbi:MAG: DUF4041 domain-containing protein [Pseudomonadota bacterium]|nr:DUF4041 domain-containing protein [Pseudomonadota bacterium]